MKLNSPLRIACDGESGSGKSTAAKLISHKYQLFCMNSGLLFRFASYLIIKHKPKKHMPKKHKHTIFVSQKRQVQHEIYLCKNENEKSRITKIKSSTKHIFIYENNKFNRKHFRFA